MWTGVEGRAKVWLMADAAQRIRMTEDEYLAFERASDEKHEYIDGEIFAMSGGKSNHSAVASGLIRVLGNALYGRRCIVHTSDMRLYIPTSRRYVYPDSSVVCGRSDMKGDKNDILLNPRIIVEVLSPSTEEYDRGDKFTHYKKIPSLAHYVLASQDEKLVEVFTRQNDDSWTCEKYEAGQKIALPAIDCEIDVDQVYANVFEFAPDFLSVP